MITLLGDLTTFYLESHRHYHTLKHIGEMFELGKTTALSESQILAIWFHDVIYDPKSKTNEVDSATFARSCLLKQGYPTLGVQVVEQVILDTREHTPTIPEAAVVLDLDLAILAAPAARYDEYAKQIKAEYDWVPAAAYAAGRIHFLESQLAKSQLFYTDRFKYLEPAARKNMLRELAALQQRSH